LIEDVFTLKSYEKSANAEEAANMHTAITRSLMFKNFIVFLLFL